jgi:hypothetical protein
MSKYQTLQNMLIIAIVTPVIIVTSVSFALLLDVVLMGVN